MDELVFGTYEGFLLGYSINTEDGGKKLKQTFATQSHTASVRCVSVAGKFLASGGTDDKVVVIDLKTRTEHTILMNHDGTVNTVAFTHGGTHLLTGSDDGSIIVTRTGNWQMEKMWKKAHGGQPVIDIAVHPSDKLALSIGGDKTLRTWNLVKGRPAFTINLASKGVIMPTEIKFSPGGDRFSLISQQNVDVWKISTAGLEKRLMCSSKPSTVQWTDDNKLFVGLDNGNIVMFTISDSQAQTYNIHKQRVKCLHYENSKLYSASSGGEVKVTLVSDQMQEIYQANASCRVTCITLNRQGYLLKKEDIVKKKDNKDESLETNDHNSEVEDLENDDTKNATQVEDLENDDTKNATPLKRKPGAFVSISYGDRDNANDDNMKPPPKKAKRRNKNKKAKNKKIE